MKQVKTSMRDLIVLLPGITGSVLEKEGKELWCPSFWSMLRGLTTLGKSLQQMSLEGDDPDVDDLGDGIRATTLIPDAVLVPGLVKIDGYTKISEMIKCRFHVKEGTLDREVNLYPPANYFELPYDWRRDNRVAARSLKNLIDLRLPQWRAYAGSEAKVILLAHSMGGIVARHYLEVMRGSEFCKALITLGTPYRGALKALDYLANGCRKYFIDMSATMNTFTSVYQLLPIYKVVNCGNAYKRVAELNIERVNPERARAAQAFHNQIMDLVDSRVKNGNRNPYMIFPIVGTYQPTWQSAELLGGELAVSDILPPDVDELLCHGDGTVPYLSAIPHELSDSYRNSFYPESHGALQCSDPVLDFIHGQMQDMQIRGLGNIRGPRFLPKRREYAAISLYVEDLYSTGSPVVIRARILEDGQDLTDMNQFRKHMSSLEALIEPANQAGASVRAPLRQAGHEWVLAYEGLQPGIYRVEVRTAKSGPLAPPAVHDLFQVAAAE
jgi:hypothetical protein